MVNILFVCKYNRFRSRIAEAYFKKINKNKKNKSKSAGIIQGRPLDAIQVSLAKEFGIDIKGEPKGIDIGLLKWQDIIVDVADDVPAGIFNNKKYVKKLVLWRIKDAPEDDREEVRRLIKKIMRKVEDFAQESG